MVGTPARTSKGSVNKASRSYCGGSPGEKMKKKKREISKVSVGIFVCSTLHAAIIQPVRCKRETCKVLLKPCRKKKNGFIIV